MVGGFHITAFFESFNSPWYRYTHGNLLGFFWVYPKRHWLICISKSHASLRHPTCGWRSQVLLEFVSYWGFSICDRAKPLASKSLLKRMTKMLGNSDYLFFANTNMKQKTIGKTFAHHIYLHLYFHAFADSPFTKKTHSPKAHKDSSTSSHRNLPPSVGFFGVEGPLAPTFPIPRQAGGSKNSTQLIWNNEIWAAALKINGWNPQIEVWNMIFHFPFQLDDVYVPAVNFPGCGYEGPLLFIGLLKNP